MASRRSTCSAGRSTRCACRWIPTSCARSRSASTRSTARCRTGTSTCRPASSLGPHSTYTLKVNGQLMSASAFAPLVVAYRHGAPVHLGDVARVVDSVEDNRNASWFYDPDKVVRVVLMTIMKQPGSNTLAVDRQHPRCCRARARLPPSVHLDSRHRSRDLDPRGVPGHQDHDGGDAGARRRRHLSVPAERLGHDHPGARPAVLDPRHVRRDAAAALQPQQPLDDGAHPLDRLRRRRRDRDAREHRAPHGARARTRKTPRCAARRKSRSRFSR